MTQECIFTGRITRLAIFRVPEFGTRASFQLPERPPQSAQWPAMSRENSLPTIAKGTSWSCVVFTNLGRQPRPRYCTPEARR